MINQLTGNIAGLFNNYVNPIAMVAMTWEYYIVWYMSSSVCLGSRTSSSPRLMIAVWKKLMMYLAMN